MGKKRATGKPGKQVAALPLARDAKGALRVLTVTSRQNQRFILPKGWPVRGLADHHAAALEAREEAGLIGRAHRKPIGSYLAWKRLKNGFQLVKVKVFLFDVERHLDTWKEKGERSIAWLSPEDAATLIDEPGLVDIVLNLATRLPRSWRIRAAATAVVKEAIGTHPVIDSDA